MKLEDFLHHWQVPFLWGDKNIFIRGRIAVGEEYLIITKERLVLAFAPYMYTQ